MLKKIKEYFFPSKSSKNRLCKFIVTSRVCEKYRRIVAGNYYLSENMITKKLNRNILLSEGPYVDITDSDASYYKYGCLRIIVKDGAIIDLLNHQVQGREIDPEQKKFMNSLLGIPNSIIEQEEVK